eukprot:scaffold357192_cov21-Prasinocladus_malaysianus.AAC.1
MHAIYVCGSAKALRVEPSLLVVHDRHRWQIFALARMPLCTMLITAGLHCSTQHASISVIVKFVCYLFCLQHIVSRLISYSHPATSEAHFFGMAY